MNNLINWAQIQDISLYEQLKNQIQLFEKDDNNKQKCALLKEKLDFIPKINDYNPEEKKRHYQILLQIDNLELDKLEDKNQKRKLGMMLSYGVLIEYFKRIGERTDEELIMLSACSSNLYLDEYTEYIGILSDAKLASAIVQKSSKLDNQLDMAYEVMDVQDTYIFGYITPDNYDFLVESGLTVVNEFEKEKER